jgi:Putative Ig domain
MSHLFPRPADRAFANPRLLSTLVVGSLVCIVALSGCGASSPKTAATTPTSPSGSGSSGSSMTISSSLPSATAGSTYSATVAVTGGTAPYTFAVASGELPQGLNLADSSGTISGTPSASGSSSFAISVSDAAGTSQQQSFKLSVASAPSNPPSNPPANPPSNPPPSGTALTSIQKSGGWSSYAQVAPNFVDCSPSPCEGITFWMGQNISNPSMDGDASGYSVGGTTGFGDALFNNHLIGPQSSQGLPDNNQTLVPSLHDFTYDVYFYDGALNVSQALEFDINQFFNGEGFIFGHECRIAGGNEWDVWDNVNQKWVPTGIACNPNQNSWNHLTIQVQRNSNDELVYQSITLNGNTSTLNWTFPHGSTPGWYGVTINYQMDGDKNQDSYTVYLDKLTFSYQ